MQRKKVLALLLAVCLVFTAAACKKQAKVSYQPANPNEEFVLQIYAAEELMAVMTDLTERYSTVAPRASVVVNYDEGAVLAAKIEAGAPCDIYVSDEQSFMDWLDQECGEEKNPNHNDKIVSDTRHDIAEGPGNEKYMPEDMQLAEGEVYTTTYSAAVCRATGKPYESEMFISFMLSEDVRDVYETYGFTQAGEQTKGE